MKAMEVPTDTKRKTTKTSILLCTCNSAKFLREQIDSFYTQTHTDWELWVSDDASIDNTLNCIRSYSDREKKITTLDGPRHGATANFLSLLRNPEIDAEYTAWSDADDIWFPDKLERAVRHLAFMGPERPGLYCGRTMVVSQDNRELYTSPLFPRPPCFQNALCQSIGGGNTMVFNRKARELLSAGSFPDVPFHDWWAYILVSACDGLVHYDSEPCLRYRQHDANLIGGNLGLAARLRRCRRLFQGKMIEWNRAHVAALESRRELLSKSSCESLDYFAQCMNSEHYWERLSNFWHSGVFRQNRIDTMALWTALAFGVYP